MAANIQIPRELEKIKDEAPKLLDQSQNILIKDDASYEAQGNNLRVVKTMLATAKEKQKELLAPFEIGVKNFKAFLKPPLDALAKAESNIKRALLAYDQVLEDQRRKAEREAEAKAKKDKEKLEKKAEKAEEKGDLEKAEDFRFEAETKPVPTVVKTQPVSGVQFKTIWKYRIVDVKKIPRDYLMVDKGALNALSSAKGRVKVPGVEFYSEKTVAGKKIK